MPSLPQSARWGKGGGGEPRQGLRPSKEARACQKMNKLVKNNTEIVTYVHQYVHTLLHINTNIIRIHKMIKPLHMFRSTPWASDHPPLTTVSSHPLPLPISSIQEKPTKQS